MSTTDKWALGIYTSTYCNFAHRKSDGMPIDHECRVLPPDALQAEIEGRYADSLRLLQFTPTKYSRGVKMPEP